MRISIEEKRSLVARYRAGESVTEICADSGVPRSTFYTWIKPYTVTITDSSHAVSQQAFIKMKQKLQKLEQKLNILHFLKSGAFLVLLRFHLQSKETVKVTLKQLVLHDPVFLLALCKSLGDLMGHPASVVEDLMLIEFQKAIQPLGPVLHGHGDMTAGLIFRIVQIHGDNAFQRLQFLFGEIILGDGHIILLNFSIRILLPGG